jgi:hypothetical protein
MSKRSMFFRKACITAYLHVYNFRIRLGLKKNVPFHQSLAI